MLSLVPKQTAALTTAAITAAAWHSGYCANPSVQAETGLSTATSLFPTTVGPLLCLTMITRNEKHTHVNVHTDFIRPEQQKEQRQLCEACQILYHERIRGKKSLIFFFALYLLLFYLSSPAYLKCTPFDM